MVLSVGEAMVPVGCTSRTVLSTKAWRTSIPSSLSAGEREGGRGRETERERKVKINTLNGI
jgi:hypothetical protein